MNDTQELLNIVTIIGNHLENDYIISAQLLRAYEDLKNSIVINKLGILNTVLQGFDRYEQNKETT